MLNQSSTQCSSGLHTARSILVVNDENRIVQQFRDLLTEEGYEVDGASSGRTALQLARVKSYDAAIIDFNLPDMRGTMLYREICKTNRKLGGRTIFVSGHVQANGEPSFNVREVVAEVRSKIGQSCS